MSCSPDSKNSNQDTQSLDRTFKEEIRPCFSHRKSAIVNPTGGNYMAKKNRMKNAAVKIGSAAGSIDGAAHKAIHKAAAAAHVARQELTEVSKQVEALKKQLKKSSKRLQNALR